MNPTLRRVLTLGVLALTLGLLIGFATACTPPQVQTFKSPGTGMVIKVTKSCPTGIKYEVMNHTDEAWDIMFAQENYGHLVVPNGSGTSNPTYEADYPKSVAQNGRWVIALRSGEGVEHFTTPNFQPCP